MGGIDRGEGRIEGVVRRARGRLRRVAGRETLRSRIWPLILGALVVGAARPLIAPLGELDPLWHGPVRALLLFALALLLGTVGLLILGRRRGPTELSAARAVDEALGEREVVASGWAFLRAGRGAAAERIAVRRAEARAAGVDLRAAFPLPSLVPSRRGVALFVPGLLVATAVGAYDPALLATLIAPPTVDERAAAEALEHAAARAEARAGRPDREARERDRAVDRERRRDLAEAAARRERMRSLAERARGAARAARRGDRQGALRRLERLGQDGRSRSARAETLRRQLRSLGSALAPRPAGAARPGGNASERRAEAAESLRLLARRTRDPVSADPAAAEEARRRTLERLSRAAEAMREEARRSEGEGAESARRAAEALERAAEALSRGERSAAAEQLEEAAARAAEMEAERRGASAEAEAIARLLEASGALERAVQMAMLGRPGDGSQAGEGREGQGTGEGRGAPGQEGATAALRRELAARLAAMGAQGAPGGDPSVGPGGQHVPERGGERRSGLEADGTIRARSQVREGQRAAAAVEGMGRRGEPTREFRDVFPSYDAMAEEAVQDEAVPAARRAVVQRYFESIRPGGMPATEEGSP